MLAPETAQARFNMIAQQIRPWNVNDDRVLEIIESIPREMFVPDAYSGLAYADVEIPLGSGASMLFPRIEARMLQALQIKPTDRILEVGTGSGYLTACLARLGHFVVSYEQNASLSGIARENLDQIGIENVRLESGNIFAADLAADAFDVIAVSGSIPNYNNEFQSLLSTGGRLFVVTGREPAMLAELYTRTSAGGHVARETLFETSLAPLGGVNTSKGFEF